jgi:uncharacterized damage-inducible protein DinB
MSETDRIQDQLRRAWEGEAWHGPSLRELLSDVDAIAASSRPLAGGHSIWELVRHIGVWKRVVAERLQGKTVKVPDEEDWSRVTEINSEAWQRELDELANRHTALMSAVATLDDSRLPDLVAGENYSVFFMLHGVVQHDLYHAGQIALLKRSMA